MKAISLTEKCEVSEEVAPGNYLCEADFVALLRQLGYMLYEELLSRSARTGQLLSQPSCATEKLWGPKRVV